MNNILKSVNITDNHNQNRIRKRKIKKEISLFPAVDKDLRTLPTVIWELREMDNKLRFYMRGKNDPLFMHYINAVNAINEIEKLEMELIRKEAQKCK